MTSQKSLRNKVNLKDFARSFQGAWLFPLVALLVLFFSMTTPVISYIAKELDEQTKATVISLFFKPNGFIFDFQFLPLGMVICGFMVAARQFNFLMSKKSVNVYLSMGISRTTLYVNRTISSLLMLLTAVLVPLTVLYGINLSNFGASSHLTQVYLYAMTSLFVSGLAGFSIGAFSSMISGNILESVITGVSISAIPMVIYMYFRDTFILRYLKGYVTATAFSKTNWTALLSPWTFVSSMAGSNGVSGYRYYEIAVTPQTIVDLTTSADPLTKVAPANLAVNKNFWIPMLVWALVSLCFLLLGGLFMKLRKAEHAKSFGNFALSRAIGTVSVVILSAYFCTDFWDNTGKGLPMNPLVLWIILLLISAVAVFLVQLLWTRKLKKTLRSLSVYAVVFAVFSIGFFTISTDLFGTYNRTPKREEISSMSMDVFSPVMHYQIEPNATTELIEGKGEKDKDLALRLFDLLKQEEPTDKNQKYLTEVMFAFKMKNGKTMLRRFPIYNKETYETYLKESVSSDYFDKVLKTQLLEKNYDEKTGEALSCYKGQLRADYVSDENEPPTVSLVYDKIVSGQRGIWYLADRNGIIRTEILDSLAVPVEDETFYESLYKDLSSMTYESFFKNTTTPVAMLSRNINTQEFERYSKDRKITTWRLDEGNNEPPSDKESKVALASEGIYLYPEMKETLRFLKENNCEITEDSQAKISEILFTDKNLAPSDAESLYVKKHERKDREYQNYYGYLLTGGRDKTLSYRGSYQIYDDICEIEMKRMTQYEWMLYLYESAGSPLKKADAKNFKAIEEAAAMNFYQINDDGRYAYIIYDNGYMECIYIPASKCDVLK